MKTRIRHTRNQDTKYNSSNATIVDFFVISFIFIFMIFVMVKLDWGSKSNQEITKALFFILFMGYFILRKKITQSVHSFTNLENPYFLTLLATPFIYFLAKWNWWIFLIYVLTVIFCIQYFKRILPYRFKESKALTKIDANQLHNNHNYYKINKRLITAAEREIRKEEHKMDYLLTAGWLSFTLFIWIMVLVVMMPSMPDIIMNTMGLMTLLAILGYFIALIRLRVKYAKILHNPLNTLLFYDFRGNDFVYSKSANARWWHDYVFYKKK